MTKRLVSKELRLTFIWAALLLAFFILYTGIATHQELDVIEKHLMNVYGEVTPGFEASIAILSWRYWVAAGLTFVGIVLLFGWRQRQFEQVLAESVTALEQALLSEERPPIIPELEGVRDQLIHRDQLMGQALSDVSDLAKSAEFCVDTAIFDGMYRKVANQLNSLLQDQVSLRENLAFSNKAINETPVVIGVWVRDGEGFKKIMVSDEVMRRYQIATKEVYLNDFDAYSPEYQPCGKLSAEKAHQLLAEGFEKGYVHDHWIHQLTDGLTMIPSAITIKKVDYLGQEALLTYNIDLRDQEATAIEERKSANRLLFTLESMPIYIEHFSQDGQLTYANNLALSFAQVRNVTEYSRMYHQLFSDTIPGVTSYSYFKERINGVFTSGHDRWEMTCYHDGKYIHMEVHAYLFLQIDEDPSVMIYSIDMSNEKQRLADLKEQHRELEQLLASDSAKDRFLARMSHELRTPLTAILGLAEVELHAKTYDKTAEEAFVNIYGSANMLLGIVSDILDLSKIKAGELSLNVDTYEMASFIYDTTRLNMVYLEEKKDVSFEVDISPDLPTLLHGDELRIKQVLNNVLSNAFKYTKRGYVVLTVYGERVSDTAFTLVVQIRDTGYGMEKQQLVNLFKDYSRFHEAEDKFITGTGLGMNITKSLVEMMNGTIEVNSVKGIGTLVEIRLPQQVSSDEVLGPDLVQHLQNFKINTEETLNKLTIDIEPMPHGRVLIVDDVKTNLKVAQGLFGRFELNISTKTSGQAAINAISSGEQYDMIFMDQMMPGIGGLEATQAIRALGYTAPIISFTANAMSESEEQLDPVYDGILFKPIQMKQLIPLLQKFIPDPPTEPLEVLSTAEEINLEDDPHLQAILDQIEAPRDLDYLKEPDLLIEIQGDYVADMEHVITEVRQFLKAEQLSEATVSLHTLKTYADMLDARELYRLAAKGERLLKESTKPDEILLSHLTVEHEALLATCREALSKF